MIERDGACVEIVAIHQDVLSKNEVELRQVGTIVAASDDDSVAVCEDVVVDADWRVSGCLEDGEVDWIGCLHAAALQDDHVERAEEGGGSFNGALQSIKCFVERV